MSRFCGSCGLPLAGQSGFCGNCGASAGKAPAAPAAPAAPVAPAAAPIAAKSAGGGALKIVLIAVCVLFGLAAVSIGGMYYAAHRYITMAENATGLKAGDVARSIRDAASRNGNERRAEKRDGCLLLSKDEASAILGIQVERVDGRPNEQKSSEHCDFYVKPGSIAEHEKNKVLAEPGSSADQPMQDRLDDIKLGARLAIEAERHGEAPYFGYTVERENGKIACAGLGLANGLSGVNLVAPPSGKAAEPLGVGDQAVMGIGESLMCVAQGNSAITLELMQIAGARSIGIALARTIVPRL